VSSPRQVLRFRSAGGDGPGVLAVILGDSPMPAGHIVHLSATPEVPARWAYTLNDGRATGLQSTLSRQDLEGQIIDYYFHDLVADQRHSA
jgi:hypothetical protein